MKYLPDKYTELAIILQHTGIDVRLINGNGPNFGVIELSTSEITTIARYTLEGGNSEFICEHLGYG